MADTMILRRFRREWLVLALVAVAALGFMHPANAQDKTRLALTQSLVKHREISIERYGSPVDRAEYQGLEYPSPVMTTVPAWAIGWARV